MAEYVTVSMISCHYLNKLSKVQAYLHTFKALLKVCRSKHIIKCHTIYINISLNVTYIKKFKNMHVCMYVCTSLFSVIFLHYTFENIFTYLLRHYAYRVTLYLLLRLLSPFSAIIRIFLTILFGWMRKPYIFDFL